MEKRIDARYECQVPLMDERKATLVHSQTIDISKSGVGFVSARFIPINTKMMIEISLVRDGEPVLVQGKVKWVEKAAESSTYRIGMTFPDISDKAQSRIEGYFKE